MLLETLAQRPQVIAHRGYHPGQRPYENTLGAFAAALDAGADKVEIDVRRTRDGELVIYHDPILRDGRRLKDVDFVALPKLPDGQSIPSLQQTLDFARERNARLLIELKEPGYELDAVERVRAALPLSQFEVMSFDNGSVATVERAMPEVRTGLLTPGIPAWLRESFAWPALAKVTSPLHGAVRAAARVGADFVAMHFLQATNGMLAAAAKRGIDVKVWTVDGLVGINTAMRDTRLEGVITNRTDLAVQVPADALVGAALLDRAA